MATGGSYVQMQRDMRRRAAERVERLERILSGLE